MIQKRTTISVTEEMHKQLREITQKMKFRGITTLIRDMMKVYVEQIHRQAEAEALRNKRYDKRFVNDRLTEEQKELLDRAFKGE